jgi:arginyl-tRNA synthetase
MKQHVMTSVHKALQQLITEWNLQAAPSISIEIPKNETFGDIATTVAMTLASPLRRAPKKIAQEIVQTIETQRHDFQKIEIAGAGFINFTFKPDFYYASLQSLLSDGLIPVDRHLGQGKSVLLEYVSANPTGPLHFGHGRGAAVGNAIAKLLIAAGYTVKQEFYINDAGRQIQLLGESVYTAYQQALGNAVEFPVDGYQGDYIVDTSQDLFKEVGDRFLNQPFEACKEFMIPWAYQKMLAWIQQDLQAFGVTFDSWQSERELFDNGMVIDTIHDLEKQGYVYEKDQAKWFRCSEFTAEQDRVLVKSDGTFTYFASDIAYHRQKMAAGFDWYINLWGADHHGYIERIKASIQALGYDSEKLRILLVQMVNLLKHGKPFQMSKRSGSFVTLKEVMDDVGADTAKFIFLTRRPDSHLDFDLETAKATSSENPVFYVQYAHARIQSIMGKADQIDFTRPNFLLLDKAEEIGLIRKICLYPLVFEGAALALEPHRITYYLQELSSLFHSYYNQYRVISEDEPLTKARLALCKAVQIVIREGLASLGVQAPDKM